MKFFSVMNRSTRKGILQLCIWIGWIFGAYGPAPKFSNVVLDKKNQCRSLATSYIKLFR